MRGRALRSLTLVLLFCLCLTAFAVPTSALPMPSTQPFGKSPMVPRSTTVPGVLLAPPYPDWPGPPEIAPSAPPRSIYRTPSVRLPRRQMPLPGALLRLHRVYAGAPGPREVALTFDDGPSPLFTPLLLSVLSYYQVRATFFLVGKRISAYPRLAREIADSGHELANHTYNHANLTHLTSAQVVAELDATNNAIEHVAGVRPHLFRPPGGQYNAQVIEVALKHGYLGVFWSVNTADYQSPGIGTIERRMLDKAKPGAIYLLHTGAQESLAALPYIIETFQAEGYRFVTVSEMLSELLKTRAAGGALHR